MISNYFVITTSLPALLMAIQLPVSKAIMRSREVRQHGNKLYMQPRQIELNKNSDPPTMREGRKLGDLHNNCPGLLKLGSAALPRSSSSCC